MSDKQLKYPTAVQSHQKINQSEVESHGSITAKVTEDKRAISARNGGLYENNQQKNTKTSDIKLTSSIAM